MSDEAGTPGRLEMQAYKGDNSLESPTANHHDIEKQYNAELLISQQDQLDSITAVEDDISTRIDPVLPTTDQKAALDAANSPDGTNGFATMADVAAQAAASQFAYDFRTDTGAPADGEIKLNNATPASATEVKVSNINKQGLNIGNQLLLLGDSDAVVIADNNDGTKVYNYNVTADPTQTGGSGTGGYVTLTVTFFSQGAGGTIADTEVVDFFMRYDGSNTKFLSIANNLSDLNNVTTAQTNLDVYSKATGDARYLLEANNLSDLVSATTAQTNLDVYSKATGDARYLLEANNLSDLDSAVTALDNLGIDSDELAAITGAAAPASGNVFATMGDLPAGAISGVHLAGKANTSSTSNNFDMGSAGDSNDLTMLTVKGLIVGREEFWLQATSAPGSSTWTITWFGDNGGGVYQSHTGTAGVITSTLGASHTFTVSYQTSNTVRLAISEATSKTFSMSCVSFK